MYTYMEETKEQEPAAKGGINIGQVRSMLDEIERMTPDEHHTIIRVLQDNEVKYTENDNGIFVKLNELSLDTIKDIYSYVEEIRSSRKDMECAIRSLESAGHGGDNGGDPFRVQSTGADGPDGSEGSAGGGVGVDQGASGVEESKTSLEPGAQQEPQSNIGIEDWKKAIIEKMKNESKNRSKRKKTSTKSSAIVA